MSSPVPGRVGPGEFGDGKQKFGRERFETVPYGGSEENL